MKKKFKFFVFILLIVFCSSCVIACFPQREIKKVSKGLSCYDITAEIDDSNFTVDVIERVKVVNNTEVLLDSICFNNYASAFKEGVDVKPYTSLNEGKCFPNGVNYGDINFEFVKLNNKEVSYNLVGENNNAIEIKLEDMLEPKDSVNVEMAFKIKLAECTHRMGYYNGSINLGNWFPILAIYENGEYIIEPYYSTGDPFYSEIANYNVTVVYPNSYVLSATGMEETISVNENKKKDKINALAVRDFAIFLTKDAEVLSKNYDKIKVKYIGEQGDENNEYCLDVAVKAVKYFSETFGKYPYETLDVVKGPFLHGGMEYPGAVLIADNITNSFDLAKVIVHEIAHQWWYGVVGNNEIKEAWLDESLAEYSTVLFLSDHKEFDVTYEELVSEAFANYTLFADISKTFNKKIKTSMLLNVNEYNSEYEYSYMIYVKGVLMFDSISQVVKIEKIKESFKKYYSKYKFKIATTDCFVSVMKSVCGKNIDVVLDSWLNGKTIIGSIK